MNVSELNNYLQEFQNETDRASAVLAGCYLDDCLDQLLSAHFINDDKFIKEQILGSGSSVVLDSFAKKIKISYALGLLRKSEFHDLNIIRKIRNDFSHKLHGLTFENQSIKDQCYNLTIGKTTIEQMKGAVKINDGARFRFTIATGVIGNFIAYRASHEAKHQSLPNELNLLNADHH